MEQIKQDELIKSDKFMLKLVFIHWFVATFITSHAFNTYLAGFIVGGLITLGVYLSYRFFGQTRFYRVTLAIAIMSFSALFIQQFYGRIELHFHVFVGLAFLTIYRDRTPIAIGSLFVITHHLIFNYLQQYNVSVFDTQIVVFNYGCGLDIVLLHGVFVLAEWFVIDRTIVNKIERYKLIQQAQNELSDANNKLKTQQDELKALNERFELTLEAVNDGMWDWNLKTDKTYYSERWKGMLGYTENEISNEGKAFFDLLHEDDRQKVEEAIKAHFQDHVNNPYYIEIRLKAKDGSYKWILARGKVHFDENGEPIRMVGYHTDITKDKQMEEQFIQQEKVIAEQSKNAALGDMIGNIAHQWRQPLSIISSGATGMKMQKEFNLLSDEQFNKTCDTINENAQYLSKTIDDFRNFINGDRERIDFNLSEIIDRFLNLVQPSFKRHNIVLVSNLDESIKLKSYPNELIQCFMNIFNNAKDALKDSPYEIKYIFIDTFREDDKVIIKFKDNANGIPEDILPKIFEPYFTTKHQSQGTGLGLHMTYNLITEGMGGSIIAHNVNFNHEGVFFNGAEFVIVIPIT